MLFRSNKYSFSSEIEFFFQNIEDLFRVRRIDQVNSNKVETAYSDLIKQSKKGTAQSEFNPEYFRLKAMVGWQIPKNNVDFINEDFKDEIRTGNVTLYLSLHSHELDITENGTVTLKAKYTSYIEAVMDNPKISNIFVTEEDIRIKEINKLMQEKNSRIDEEKASGKEPRILAEEVDKLQKERDELETGNREKIYGKILNGLYNNNILRYTLVDKTDIDNILAYMVKQPSDLSDEEKIRQQNEAIKSIKQRNESYGSVSQVGGYSVSTLDESSRSKTGEDLNKKIQNFTDAANDKLKNMGNLDPASTKKPVIFFFLGDLLQIILKDIFNPEDIKLATFPDKLVKVMLGPITFYDFGQLVDSGFVVKTPGLRTGDKGTYTKIYTGARYAVNIADLPISLSVFTTWFNTNIVDKGVVSMSFKELVEQIVNDLVIRTMSAETYAFAPRQKTRLVYKAFSLPRDEYLPSNVGDKYSYRYLAESMQKPGEGKVFKDVRGEIKEDEKSDNYMFIYGYLENAWDLKSVYEEDIRRGIRWLYYGAENGLVKSIKFKRQDNPAIRAHNIKLASQGSAGDATLLREIYNVDLEMFGNGLFDVGQTVYITPSFYGSTKLGNRIKFAKDLNIGGYFNIIKINNSIEAGKFNTSMDLRWTSKGEGKIDIGDKAVERVDNTMDVGTKVEIMPI